MPYATTEGCGTILNSREMKARYFLFGSLGAQGMLWPLPSSSLSLALTFILFSYLK